MEYLTVGIKDIKSDTFRNVIDTEATNIKPKGGLWFTRYENLSSSSGNLFFK